jgi:hypothetical protein
MKIFIDLDDTLNQLTMPTLRSKGCQGDYPVEVGYDIVAAYWKMFDLGVNAYPSKEDFFGDVNWATLPRSKEFDLILKSFSNFTIVSKICGNEASDKVAWIESHVPGADFILHTGERDFCDGLLIDDCEENFTHHKGAGILMPRPWNSLNKLYPDTKEYLEERFRYAV